ncbi:MAG: hypothetical protein ILA02_00140 [Clostridia bacterium]|nr:hypothetical protein [Clostridia bacterium]
MREDDAINYLDKLERGNFLTVNIPISRDDTVQVTAMYIGKDELGRYNFVDKGNLILSKEFLERGKVTIDKEFNKDDAFEIYSKVRTKLDKQHKKDLSR